MVGTPPVPTIAEFFEMLTLPSTALSVKEAGCERLLEHFRENPPPVADVPSFFEKVGDILDDASDVQLGKPLLDILGVLAEKRELAEALRLQIESVINSMAWWMGEDEHRTAATKVIDKLYLIAPGDVEQAVAAEVMKARSEGFLVAARKCYEWLLRIQPRLAWNLCFMNFFLDVTEFLTNEDEEIKQRAIMLFRDFVENEPISLHEALMTAEIPAKTYNTIMKPPTPSPKESPTQAPLRPMPPVSTPAVVPGIVPLWLDDDGSRPPRIPPKAKADDEIPKTTKRQAASPAGVRKKRSLNEKAKAKALASRSNPLHFVFETLKATNVYFVSDGRVRVDGLEEPEDSDLSDDIKDEP